MVNSLGLRRLSAVTLACVLAATTSAWADGSVSALRKPSGGPAGMGARPGEMAFFDSIVQQYNASGERFRIDGLPVGLHDLSCDPQRLHHAWRKPAVPLRRRPADGEDECGLKPAYAGRLQFRVAPIPHRQSFHGHVRLPHHSRTRHDLAVRLSGLPLGLWMRAFAGFDAAELSQFGNIVI